MMIPWKVFGCCTGAMPLTRKKKERSNRGCVTYQDWETNFVIIIVRPMSSPWQRPPRATSYMCYILLLPTIQIQPLPFSAPMLHDNNKDSRAGAADCAKDEYYY
mmetsp:Transcript_9215/g.19868  ORF Transcript_9215/g.19868 Transcript_9215/m.19868 type:complete len:104 (-) Transcript_9215:1141-1452(-)